MTDLKSKRSRVWHLVLYKDNAQHLEVLRTVTDVAPDYAYILHKGEPISGRSPEAEEDEGKEHVHCVFGWPSESNARTQKSIARLIGLSDSDARLLRPCGKLSENLLYLVHYGFANKIQYRWEDDVFATSHYTAIFRGAVSRYDSCDEDVRIRDLLTYVNCAAGLKDLTEYALSIGALGTLHKYQYLFVSLLREKKGR